MRRSLLHRLWYAMAWWCVRLAVCKCTFICMPLSYFGCDFFFCHFIGTIRFSYYLRYIVCITKRFQCTWNMSTISFFVADYWKIYPIYYFIILDCIGFVRVRVCAHHFNFLMYNNRKSTETAWILCVGEVWRYADDTHTHILTNCFQ